MKATFRAGSGFTIDQDCSDLKEVFAFVGSCQNLFAAAEECENCKGSDLRLHYKKVKDYEFYSLLCHACKWEFAFGQLKDGSGFFPKGWQPPYDRGGDNQKPCDEQTKESLKRNAPF